MTCSGVEGLRLAAVSAGFWCIVDFHEESTWVVGEEREKAPVLQSTAI
jgi:hypothetical protein